ncbi:hypothetical protein ACIA5D_47405 [Actinoplanes sp. NPDC051513]
MTAGTPFAVALGLLAGVSLLGLLAAAFLPIKRPPGSSATGEAAA